MQLRMQQRSSVIVALALSMGAFAVPAQGGILDLPVSEQNDTYVFQFFSDVDDIRVITHQNDYVLTLQNQTALRVHLAHQTVIVPAIDAPRGSAEAVDAITTASRPIRDIGDAYEEYARTRQELTFDVTRPRWNAGYYVSTEEDYFAQLVRGGYTRDFRGQTLNLSAGVSYGWDSIESVPDADSQQVADHRNTAYANAVITQVFSPTTVLRLGVEKFWVNGLQHNPYRHVYVDGGNLPELHPDERNRNDVYVRLHQYLPMQASLKVLWKYYFDDWGITSHTIGSSVSQYVSDNVIVRYRYRFYRQTEADFYREDYLTPGGVNGLRTGDYRLSAFDAHLFGTRVHWAMRDLLANAGALSRLSLQFSYERYFNSNNFSANIFEAGFALDF